MYLISQHVQPTWTIDKIDKIADAEKEILRTALKVAQHHGLAIDLIKASPQTTHHEADAFAPVCQGEQETLYPVACKRIVSQQFVLLCRNLDLFAQERSAIEGSKFKAVNNRDRNFTKARCEHACSRSRKVSNAISACWIQSIEQSQ